MDVAPSATSIPPVGTNCFVEPPLNLFLKTMSGYDRVRRQQVIREAEGYLDLIMVFVDQWPPTSEARDRVARRALATLDDAEVSGRDAAYTLYLKGQALRSMEQYGDALRALRESADADPANIHVWLALGWCYKRIGRLDLAIESLEEGLMVDAGVAIVHYNLACYWSLVNNSQHALHHLGVAFDIDSNYRDLVSSESDFDPIRSDPDFRTLTSVIV